LFLLKSPCGYNIDMSDAAVPALQARGTPAVLRVKLSHHFGAHRKARAETVRKDLRTGWLLTAGGAASLALGAWGAWFADFEPAWVGVIMGVVVGIAGILVIADAIHRGRTEPEARPAAQKLLATMLQDFIPTAPLHLGVDARSASVATEPERTTTSPYSGSSKRYYRHEWLQLKGYLADGSLLGLTFTQLQKVKAGLVIRDQLQVRGRLRLAEGRTLPALPRASSGFSLQPAGEREVVFWGYVLTEEEMATKLTALLRLVHGPVGA
jgi:hypothetical protein